MSAIVRLTAEDLDRIERYAQAASSGQWMVGRANTETIEAAVEYMATALRKRADPELWMVFVGDPNNEVAVPAYTGNGPTSQANANYLAIAQPHNMLVLVRVLRAIMNSRSYLVTEGEHITIEAEP